MPARKKPERKKKDDGFSDFMVTALKGVVEDQESVHVLEDFQDLPPVKEWIHCPMADLDRVISNGRGLPVGRAIEIFGKQQSGKTAISLLFAEQVINDGGPVLWLDAEHQFNPDHSKRLRKTGRFFHVQPDHMEECWDAIWAFLKTLKAKGQDAPGLIVWDSIAGTPTKSELEGKQEVATQARVMSINSRRGRKRIARSRCAVIFINQVRTKIGGMGYGDNTVRPCGMALDFMCDVMLKNTIIGTDSEGSGDDRVADGYMIKTMADKSRLGRPRAQTTWYLSFDTGPDAATTALMYLKKAKIIKAVSGNLVMKTAEGEQKMKSSEWPSYFEENKEALSQIMVSIAKKEDKPAKADDDTDEDDTDDEDAPPKKPSRPAPEPAEDD